MDKTKFAFMKKRIFIIGLVYCVICEVVSAFIIGFDGRFLMGLSMGFVSMIINLELLGKVVGFYMKTKRLGLAIILYIARLALYAAVALICYKLSMHALLAFAVGVFGIVIGALVSIKKEGAKGV